LKFTIKLLYKQVEQGVWELLKIYSLEFGKEQAIALVFIMN
jgi:hypothetical protein